eukprot:TRINITY_DN6627_c0_g1_i8.p2 TRINITY_DN6627_c0_g1~~TRINITY_DN6627_c0_g1_i8.p2  ORF type:complete len:130 (+),score=2.96 TRINITY_DN6627_c0_g1_i8:142-531(+)
MDWAGFRSKVQMTSLAWGPVPCEIQAPSFKSPNSSGSQKGERTKQLLLDQFSGLVTSRIHNWQGPILIVRLKLLEIELVQSNNLPGVFKLVLQQSIIIRLDKPGKVLRVPFSLKTLHSILINTSPRRGD